MKKILLGMGLTAVSLLALAACASSQGSSDRETSSSQSAVVSSQGSSSSSSQAPSATVISERYDVSYGDKKLYGMITAPENYKELQLPLIVIAHGFNNTLEQYEDYAQQLASQGYVVYRFDFYGGSRQSKSGGQDMLDMSVKTEQEDLTQVVSQLSAETYIDSGQVTLLGASQGGVVSTLYAAANPDKVQKLILIFPAYVLFDDIKETYDRLGVASPDDLPAVLTHRNAQLGRRYVADALDIDIREEMKKVRADTLIIHGTQDDVVPYRYGVEASQTIPKAQLVTVEGGGHWISPDFNAVATPAIEEFLKK